MNKKNYYCEFAKIISIIFLINIYFYSYAIYGDEVYIDIQPDILDFTIIAGDSYESSFKIINNGPEGFQYNISYSTIFEVDEYTIGLWNFNEGNGIILHDSSNNNYHGDIVGAKWVNGKFGKALKFDGWDDYVLFNNFSSQELSGLTIESWVKIDPRSGWSPIGPVKFWEYGLLYNQEGYLRTHIWADGLKWYDVPVELENSWHYIAMTFNVATGNLRLFLDGNLIESRYEGQDVINSTSNKLILGRSWTKNMWDFFNGTIDEIRISKVAKSSNDIKKVFQSSQGIGEWIKIKNNYGTIKTDSEANISLLLNASQIDLGIHERKLTINSNSLDGISMIVPVRIDVLPLNHDLSLESVNIENYIIAENKTDIKVKFKNKGTVMEKDFIIKLLINDTLIKRKKMDLINPGDEHIVYLRWIPMIAGVYDCKITIEPVEGEGYIRNNRYHSQLLVDGEPLIRINRDKLNVNITNKDKVNEIIKISNIGTSNLEYLLYDTNSSIIFYDDFEVNSKGWSHMGEFDTWEVGVPKIGPDGAKSGSYCWGTSLDDNYPDLCDASLETPLIDLTRRNTPIFSFWNWYSIDSNEDRALIEIWDGDRWNRINGDGYYGYSYGWINQTFDLTEYAGKIIKIRFRLDTNEYIRDKGWYVDDVVIKDKHIKNDWIKEMPREGIILPKESNIITISIVPSISLIKSYNETLIIRSNDVNNRLIKIPINIFFNNTDYFYNYSYPDIAERNKTILLVDLGPDITIEEDFNYTFTIYNMTTNVTDIKYVWSFYDVEEVNLMGKNPGHVFNDPGIYEVTLNIYTDDQNVTASDTYTINVKDTTDPIAVIGDHLEDLVENVITFDGSNSSDNVGIKKYVWNYGDGSNGTGMTTDHHYIKEGLYKVTLIVLDFEGNMDDDWILIKINGKNEIKENEENSVIINKNYLLGITVLSSLFVLGYMLYVIYKK